MPEREVRAVAPREQAAGLVAVFLDERQRRELDVEQPRGLVEQHARDALCVGGAAERAGDGLDRLELAAARTRDASPAGARLLDARERRPGEESNLACSSHWAGKIIGADWSLRAPFSVRKRSFLLFTKIGRPAYSQPDGRPVAFQSLGDANRGAVPGHLGPR